MLCKKNILILFVILLFINFSLFSQSEGEPAGPNDPADSTDPVDSTDPADSTDLSNDVVEDPAASLPQQEITDSPSEQRLTDLEFANLSDEEKRNIYFNFPWLLPENFNPDVYMHIFHPQSSTSLKSNYSLNMVTQRYGVKNEKIY